jgi:hypothetical protein
MRLIVVKYPQMPIDFCFFYDSGVSPSWAAAKSWQRTRQLTAEQSGQIRQQFLICFFGKNHRSSMTLSVWFSSSRTTWKSWMQCRMEE